MTGGLQIGHFSAFFEAAHGTAPFPWQRRLAGEVARRRAWPDLFDLPTGAGKTAIVDVAVFLMALDASCDAAERWMPRRAAMVVDRRVVVDQVAVRARVLADALDRAVDGPLAMVRDALCSLVAPTGNKAGARSDVGGDVDPLVVTVLRGGVVQDSTWVRRPDQPTVMASTVDQVGSRLLFQGYGVSPGMQPVHAGLLGNDTLIILDEVHLSQPLAETLRAIRDRFRGPEQSSTLAGAGLPDRWMVTELSATPGRRMGGWVFRRDPMDDDGSPEAELFQRRVRASKPASLREVRVPKKNADEARTRLAKACVGEVGRMLTQPDVSTVGIVVNRVATAASVMEHLEGVVDEAVLLTGRMRPLERDALVERLAARLSRPRGGSSEDRASGPDHTAVAKDTQLAVVATQCIEAGADFDFDALVTECASLDALRQRFGRLDRIGLRSSSGLMVPASILGSSAAVAEGADDPVYGEALANTWAWLQERAAGGAVDFGVSAMDDPHDESLQPRAGRAPVLLPTHLDAWMETPQPGGGQLPSVAPWLHGSDKVEVDVHVVWRADLSRDLLDKADQATSGDRDALDTVVDLLSFCRPLSTEALSVPITAVRAWLSDEAIVAPEVGDVEGEPEVSEDRDRDRGSARPFAVWAGDDSFVSSDLRRLVPGATVVVPSTYGGMRPHRYGEVVYGWWSPQSTEPVTDLGDRAHRERGQQLVVRWFPEGIRGAERHFGGVPVPGEREPDDSAAEHLAQWDRSALDEQVRSQLDAVLDALRPGRRGRLREFAHVDDRGELRAWYAASVTVRPSRERAGPVAPADVDLDPATSSFTGATGAEAGLREHLAGVGAKAGGFARRCGLPEPIVGDIQLAGALHDLGKADERFQAWLRSGMPRTTSQALLAKSATPAFDRVARRIAREKAGYPAGARHEALSLAMVDGCDDVAAMAHDWDLVRHLVVSHHGWARPFVPAVIDEDPRAVTYEWEDLRLSASADHGVAALDSGVAERYWSLVERYGHFRLAWFEAIFRLADQRRSEEELTIGGAP